MNDPFVLAVTEILSSDRSKYFIEWLAQTRFQLSTRIAQSENDREQSRILGAICLCDDILKAVESATQEAKISTKLSISINGFLGEISLPPKKISVPRKRGTASSEPQIKI